MKIGISCHALKHSGGIERYAMDLVRGLSDLGIKPVFFAKKFDTSITEFALVDPCKISTRWLPQKLRDNFFSYRLQKKKVQYGVDKLISCNRVSSSDIAICGGTHIGFLRAMGQTAGLADHLQTRLEKKQYASAQHIIAHSRLMVDELRADYGISEEKISLAYPPADTTRFTVVSAEKRCALREKFQFPKDKVVFLFPSSSHKRKGFPLLAEFFKKTNLPVILAVVGRPIKSDSPNIRYLGFRKDIEECYQAADFTILASHYEPFGLVGIESVLCGTPVVMAENIGCLEILSDSAKLTFNSRDPASLAAAVATAAGNGLRRDNRLQTPAEHITSDIEIESHIKIILALCARIA
ncbi:MAG: glycosyltransferase family 4 protein [Burkholderiaceae bacterium]